MDGQKHKKKAASIVTTNKEPVPSGSYRCELCDVTCTGLDAYNAHLKGARHVKVCCGYFCKMLLIGMLYDYKGAVFIIAHID